MYFPLYNDVVDVVGLFTNVPVEDSIILAAETLYNGKYELPPVDKETFIQLCRLSLTNVIMLTTDGIYVQKEGLAMGSPASPLLANLWLNQLECCNMNWQKLLLELLPLR